MFIADKLINFLSGLGTDRDKTSYGHFAHTALTKDQIDALYEGSAIAAKVVDLPADDITREWRKWNGGPRQVKAMEVAERQLRVRFRVNHALKMARLYGGAAILIGVDGDEDPSLPLEPESLPKGGIKYLHVLSRYEIWAGELDRDPLSTTFGDPVYYVVASAGTAPPPLKNLGVGAATSPINVNKPVGSLYVHPSRVIRFLGPAKLELARAVDGWGISVYSRIYEAIRNAEAVAGNLASLTHEAKIDVIKIPGLTQNIMNDEYRRQLTTRFTTANQAKSIQSMLILDADEEWEQKTSQVTGLADVLSLFLEVVSGYADIPQTRMLGISAKGLNANGAENTRNYYDSLSAKQETELRPGLERLDDLLIRHAIGARPAELDFSWIPLWQMRENELSAIALQKAQTAQIHATIGAFPKSALAKGIQSQVTQDDLYPGIGEALQEAAANGEQPEPLVTKEAEIGAEINTPSATARTPKAQ